MRVRADEPSARGRAPDGSTVDLERWKKMKKVFNYKLPLGNQRSVEMPVGAEILHMDMQAGEPTMWAMIDSGSAIEERRFHVIGTGWDIPGHTVYRGTIVDPRGAEGLPNGFVWHVWEECGIVPV